MNEMNQTNEILTKDWISINGLINTIKNSPSIELKELKKLYPEEWEEELQATLNDLVAIGQLTSVQAGENYYMFVNKYVKIHQQQTEENIGIYDNKFTVVVFDGKSDLYYAGLYYQEAREKFQQYKKHKYEDVKLFAGRCCAFLLDSFKAL